MSLYIVHVNTRTGDDTCNIGTFTSIEQVKTAIQEYLGWSEEELQNYKEFGSNINSGNIYTEEEVIETSLLKID